MNTTPKTTGTADLEERKNAARAELDARAQGDLFLDGEINQAETLAEIDGLVRSRKRRRPRATRSATATEAVQMVMDLEKVPATGLDHEDFAPEPSEDVADHHQDLSIGAVVIQGSSQCRSSPFNRIPYRQWRVPPHSNPAVKVDLRARWKSGPVDGNCRNPVRHNSPSGGVGPRTATMRGPPLKSRF